MEPILSHFDVGMLVTHAEDVVDAPASDEIAARGLLRADGVGVLGSRRSTRGGAIHSMESSVLIFILVVAFGVALEAIVAAFRAHR
jgi:hypothetical protein